MPQWWGKSCPLGTGMLGSLWNWSKHSNKIPVSARDKSTDLVCWWSSSLTIVHKHTVTVSIIQSCWPHFPPRRIGKRVSGGNMCRNTKCIVENNEWHIHILPRAGIRAVGWNGWHAGHVGRCSTQTGVEQSVMRTTGERKSLSLWFIIFKAVFARNVSLAVWRWRVLNALTASWHFLEFWKKVPRCRTVASCWTKEQEPYLIQSHIIPLLLLWREASFRRVDMAAFGGIFAATTLGHAV